MRKKTFLATTALQEFWDQSQAILFLSEWCVKRDQDPFASISDDDIFFYNYSESETTDAYDYTVNMYNQLLKTLSDWMNSIHEKKYSQRYWKILLGPFLSVYVRNIYTKFDLLKKIYNLNPDLSTIGLEESSYITPIDTAEFLKFADCSDGFNLQIISQVLSFIHVPERFSPFDWKKELEDRSDFFKNSSIKNDFFLNFKVRVIRFFLKVFSRRMILICQYVPYLKKKKFLKVYLKTFFRIMPVLYFGQEKSWPSNTKINFQIRRQLEHLHVDDFFSKIVLSSLKYNIPLNFIENYVEFAEKSASKYPYHVSAITAEVGYIVDDLFKFWAATQAEKKVRLIGSQHGGPYWILPRNVYEFSERESVDRFLSWGWQDSSSVVPGVSLRISSNYEYYKKNTCQKDLILWVGTVQTRYQYPLAKYIYTHKQYASWQKRFYDQVPDEILQQIVMRLNPNSPYYEFYRNFFPKIRVEQPAHIQLSFVDHLARTKIFIGDNLNTTQSYALAFNIPTIWFLEKETHDIHKDALPYFDELEEVGIFHSSPESASIMLSKIIEDPDCWWKSQRVQSARRKFCSKFSLISENWYEDYVKAVCLAAKY